MKKVINPGRARKSINFIDNIVYSRQKNLNGQEMELKMSIMLQNGNSEMRLVMSASGSPRSISSGASNGLQYGSFKFSNSPSV